MVLRKRWAACLVVFVLGGLMAACTSSSDPGGPILPVLASPAPPSAVADPSGSPAGATCGPVEPVDPFDPPGRDAEHILGTQRPPLTEYTSVPPASGPHASTTMSAGVYDQPVPVDLAIHSMEHGAAVIWFDPNADPAAVEAVRAVVDADPEQTIMAPYSFPEEGLAGTLPDGTQMALVAWRRMQSCEAPDPAAVKEFLETFRAPPAGGGTYQGEAPEPGAPI